MQEGKTDAWASHIMWPLVISLLWWFLSDLCLLPPKMTRTSQWQSNWILHDPIIWRVWLFGKIFDDDVLCQSGKIPWFLRVSGFQLNRRAVLIFCGWIVWIGCHQGKNDESYCIPFLGWHFWGNSSRCSRIVHLFLASTNLMTSRRGEDFILYFWPLQVWWDTPPVFRFCPKLPLVAAVF